MADEDQKLPRASVNKMITESLPEDFRCNAEAKELIRTCCTEVVNLLATQANQVCLERKRKMITGVDIVTAIEQLELGDKYVKIAQEALNKHSEDAKSARSRKKSARLEDSGVSMEELQRQQEELFKKAKDEMSMNRQESGAADDAPVFGQDSGATGAGELTLDI